MTTNPDEKEIEALLRARLDGCRTTPEFDRRVLGAAFRSPAPALALRRLAVAAALLAAAAASAAVVGRWAAGPNEPPPGESGGDLPVKQGDVGGIECAAGGVGLGFLFPLSARETAERSPLIYAVRPIGRESAPSAAGGDPRPAYVARVLAVLKGDPLSAGTEVVLCGGPSPLVSRLGASGTMSCLASEHWPAIPDEPGAWLASLESAEPARDEHGRARLRYPFDPDFRATLVSAEAVAGIAPTSSDADGVVANLGVLLFASLDDPSADVRASAIRSLRNWDGVDPSAPDRLVGSSLGSDAEGAALLLRCARDPDARVRWVAAWILPSEDEAGRARLASLLFDPVRIVRQPASYVLARRGGRALSDVADAIADYELDEIGSPLAPDSMASDEPATVRDWLLNHEQGSVRARAAASLGAGRAPSLESTRALAAALANDPDFATRRAAARSLGLVPEGETAAIAIEGLAAGVADADDARLRATAGWALAKLGDPRGVPRLAAIAAAGDTRAAAQAVGFLSDAGDPVAAFPALLAAARDPRPAVRGAAVVALGRLPEPPDPEAVAEILSSAAADSSPYVRAAAAAATR